MTEQLTLIDTDPPPHDQPRCRLCPRPAHRNTFGDYTLYCRSNGCANRERYCQSCGELFTINADQAGTRYCSTECKRVGYTIGLRSGRPVPQCAWGCGTHAKNRLAGQGAWPYICNDCMEPLKHLIKRLRKHKVNHGRVRRLLTNPGCDICGANVVELVKDSNGRLIARLVVDHDHRCCPGAVSCGRCVRGLICGHCNHAIGQVHENPAIARAIADYLEPDNRADF